MHITDAQKHSNETTGFYLSAEIMCAFNQISPFKLEIRKLNVYAKISYNKKR